MKLLMLLMLPLIANGQAKVNEVIKIISVDEDSEARGGFLEAEVGHNVMDGDLLVLTMVGNGKTHPSFQEVKRVTDKGLTLVVAVKEWAKGDLKSYPVATDFVSLVTLRGPQLLVDVKTSKKGIAPRVEVIRGGALLSFFATRKTQTLMIKDMTTQTSMRSFKGGLAIGIAPTTRDGLHKAIKASGEGLAMSLSIY